MDYMVHCMCSAILPPCPETPCRNVVPLAQVTVATDGCACTVSRICNWTTERRIVRTFDNFAYWLEPLNIVRTIREALDAMCCDLFGLRDKYQRVIDRLDPCGRKPQANDPAGAAAANVTVAEAEAAASQPMHEEIHSVRMKSVPKDFYRLERAGNAKVIGGVGLEALFAKKSLLNPVQLFNGVLGGKDADGNAYLKDEERKNLMTYLGANYLAAPAVRQSMPGALSGAFEMVGGLLSGLGGDASGFDMAQMFGGASASKASASPASSAANESTDEVKAMKAELAEMKKTVELQQKEIQKIQKSKKSKG